jgi:hypothetical protein
MLNREGMREFKMLEYILPQMELGPLRRLRWNVLGF